MILDIFNLVYVPQKKPFALSLCLAWCRSAFFAFHNCSKSTLCAFSGLDLQTRQNKQSLHLPFHWGCRQEEVQEDTQVFFLSQSCRKLLGVRHSFALVVGSLAELSFLVCCILHAKASDPTYCLILLTIQQLFALGARLEKHGAPMGGDSLPNADSTLRSSEAAFPSLVSIGLHAALLPLSTRRSATAILLH